MQEAYPKHCRFGITVRHERSDPLLLVLASACGALCRSDGKQPWLEQPKLHFAKVEKSRQAALRVLQADASDATALMSLLENQLLLRQRAEARLSAQKLTRLLSPRDPRYFRVASLLAAHQDYVAAIPLMENVQREFPQSYEVNFNMALAYFGAQAYEKAAETLGSLINHEPRAEAYNLLASLEEQRQATTLSRCGSRFPKGRGTGTPQRKLSL